MQNKAQGLADASRVIAWTLHDNKDKLNERLYAFNVAIGKQADDVLDRMSSQLGVAINSNEDDGSDEFDVDIESSSDEVSYKPLIDLFSDEAKKEEAVETLIDICRGIIEEEKGKKTGTAALKAITSANSRLMEVELGRADVGTYHAMTRQLDQIIKRAGDLKSDLEPLIASISTSQGAKSPGQK